MRADVVLRRARGARERWAATFPSARFTADLDELLADPELDAIGSATPVPTHGPLAERVLRAGKHCFVEKPLAYTVEDAERAVAAATDRILMVGHLLVYHPGVAKLKEIADCGELGDIHYIYSQRLNLGKLRTDENALWSLGAHDVSVILHLAGEDPYAGRGARRGLHEPGRRGRRVRVPALPVRGRRAPAHVVAGPAQDARVHGRRLQADGDVRRHGARAQGHRLRQGLRRGRPLLRRVHHALGGHPQPADRQPRAAAARVRALRRVHPRRAPSPAPTGKRGCGSSACWRTCRPAEAPQAATPSRAARLSRPASVQITWSRPGPTPISAIGTPTASEMYCR